MTISNPLDLAKALEEKHNVLMWRKSWVVPANLSSNGKKQYFGEYPSKTPKDIKDGWLSSTGKSTIPGRGYDTVPQWANKNGDLDNAYPGCSIYLKFIKDLYVIDFDTKDKCIDTNPYFKFCMEQETIYIETAKGFHFYFYIPDTPDFTCSTKIENNNDLMGDVDIVGRKGNKGSFNIIEAQHHEVKNGESIDNIKSVNWTEMKLYLNFDRMVGIDKKKNDKLTRKEKNETSAILKEGYELPEDKFKQYLSRLRRNDDPSNSKKKSRWHYEDWLSIGMICWNNFKDTDKGFQVWLDWTKTDPNTEEQGHDHYARTISYLMEKWVSFRETECPKTWKTLRQWANIDDPAVNIYQEIYDQGGVEGVVNYMNGFIAYVKNTSELIFQDPDDDTDFAQLIFYKLPSAMGTWECFPIKYIDPETQKIKFKNPLDIWRMSPRRKNVCGICFDPRPNPSPKYHNLFQGFDITKEDVEDIDIQEAEEKIQDLLNHILIVWCKRNQEYYDFVINWFAFILQKPWQKIGVLLCAKSKEGSGKGIVFDFMRSILGGRLYAQINSLEQILGKNNAILEGRLLINGDEIIWGGNIKDGNALKGLITEPEVWIEEKYRAKYKINNTTAFAFASNEDRALSSREGDRRSFGLELDNRWSGRQKTPEHTKYFQDISGCSHHGIKREKAEGFAKYLFERDLSNFNVRNPPITEFVSDQIERNWSPLQKFWYKVLLDGAFTIDKKFMRATPIEYQEGDFTKTKWEPYDEKQLIWGNVDTKYGNGMKELTIKYLITQKPIVGYAFVNEDWNDKHMNNLKIDWRKLLIKNGIKKEIVNKIPIPESFVKSKKSNGNYGWEDNLIEKSYGFNDKCIQPNKKKPKIDKDINLERYDDWHLNNQYIEWHIADLLQKDEFVKIQNNCFDDDMEDFEHNGNSYLRKGDFIKDNEITDLDEFNKYIARWENGVNINNFNKDLVCRNWYDVENKQLFYTEYHENITRWVYNKDWVYDRYKESTGVGYGQDNVDNSQFWKGICEMLGGEKKLNKGGKYSSLKLSNGTDRKQYWQYVKLEKARKLFEGWTGRLIKWEGDKEDDFPNEW
jgi:hypothetical protein